MRGGMSTAKRAGWARQVPALSARVPIVSYKTIRLLVWYLLSAAAKHLCVCVCEWECVCVLVCDIIHYGTLKEQKSRQLVDGR